MNLKDRRYNLYIIDEGSLSDVGENYHEQGGRLHCSDVIDYVSHLQHDLELSDSEVLYKLKESLK